jgi:transcriptional regulator GlxA family with amidase domain
LYGLYDVLLSVGSTYPDMTVAMAGDALLDVRIVAAGTTPFRCFGGVPVEPHASIADLDRVDVAVVCDMYTPIDTPPRNKYPTEIAWLRRIHDDGALIATVCTGSVLLAESGLLDGRSCASHWAYGELFKASYPRITFDPSSILDVSSEKDGLITAGGVTAWYDLVLHLIARLCGPEVATQTAKVYLLAGHEDGQLPFSAMTMAVRAPDAAIRACLDWVATHYAQPNPVMAMTERSGLTSRTFARRFQAATGRRPMEYVHGIRIEAARHRIEAGGDRLDDVGFDVGYEDPTFFRRLFKRTTGLTPAAYRKKYAARARPAA